MEEGGRGVRVRVIDPGNRLDRSLQAWTTEGVSEPSNDGGLEAEKGKKTVSLELLEPC